MKDEMYERKGYLGMQINKHRKVTNTLYTYYTESKESSYILY